MKIEDLLTGTEEKALNVDELANLCGVAKQTVYKWHMKGLPSTPVGKNSLHLLSDVRKFFQSKKRGGNCR